MFLHPVVCLALHVEETSTHPPGRDPEAPPAPANSASKSFRNLSQFAVCKQRELSDLGHTKVRSKLSSWNRGASAGLAAKHCYEV